MNKPRNLANPVTVESGDASAAATEKGNLAGDEAPQLVATLRCSDYGPVFPSILGLATTVTRLANSLAVWLLKPVLKAICSKRPTTMPELKRSKLEKPLRKIAETWRIDHWCGLRVGR